MVSNQKFKQIQAVLVLAKYDVVSMIPQAGKKSEICDIS